MEFVHNDEKNLVGDVEASFRNLEMESARGVCVSKGVLKL